MEERVFGGRYRIAEKVGEGGMADVYKAVDEVLGRTVALKVMHPQLASDETFAARFREEARSAAELQSQRIVTIFDWGQDDSSYYIAMEYLPGEDLKSLIVREGALPSERVAEIGAEVSTALSVAHEHQVIHRDISPQNIMVMSDGAVKVTDFGIARSRNTELTQAGTVLGSAHYIAPEQAQGDKVGPAADIYSLGVVLFEAATGATPFNGDTATAVAYKQVSEPPPQPHELNSVIDPALEAIILKAMAKQPEDRYATAEAMRDDLLAVSAGHAVDSATRLPVVPAPVSPADTTAVLPAAVGAGPRPDANRKRLLPWLLIALAVIALGVIVSTRTPGVRADVPDVTGMSRSDAEAAIARAGFNVGAVTEERDAEAVPGEVVNQAPAAGTSLRKGSDVDLVVSAGPGTVAAPNIRGLNEDEARSEIEKAGLTPKALGKEYSSSVPAGKVIRQSPEAGEQVAEGGEVQYVVSAGQPPSDDKKDKGKGKPTDKDDD